MWPLKDIFQSEGCCMGLQMVVVLKKLTYGAMFSPSEVSEEFREGVFRGFRTLYLNLDLCSHKSCSCKQINGSPTLLARRDM